MYDIIHKRADRKTGPIEPDHLIGNPKDRNEFGILMESVSVSRGNAKVLHDINFAARSSEISFIAGQNGAGKSTVMDVLALLIRPDTGRVWIGGHDAATAPVAALRCLGAVFQQSSLDTGLTVRRNLRYAAALRGLVGRTAQSRINDALHLFGLAEFADHPVQTLSGGYRRRTEIARALLGQPRVLILDEPTTGLDPDSRRKFQEVIRQLCQDRGLCVLWATHLPDEIRPGDHAILMGQGKINAAGLWDSLRNGDAARAVFQDKAAAS